MAGQRDPLRGCQESASKNPQCSGPDRPTSGRFPAAAAADTQEMDFRIKTFAAEAAKHPDFLTDGYGFTGPDVQPDDGAGTA